MAETRYYRVSPKFWSDPTVLSWDDDARLLALYLLTCEHRTTEGLFRLPKQYILADLEWSPERLAEPFARLCGDGFIDYDDNARVLLIVKALAYQSPSNPNGVTAAIKALSTLPPNRLYERFYDLAGEHCERLREALVEPLRQPLGHPPAPAPAPAPAPNPLRPEGRDEAAGEIDAEDPADEAASTFELFWQQYPMRHGKKKGKGNALIEWRKLTVEHRRRAFIGARHLAASDELPPDAERFLRRPKGGKGDFPFDDWQEPATPTIREVKPRQDPIAARYGEGAR